MHSDSIQDTTLLGITLVLVVPMTFSSVSQFHFFRYPVHSTSSLFYRQKNSDQTFTGFSQKTVHKAKFCLIILSGEELWQMLKILTSMQYEKYLLKTGPLHQNDCAKVNL